MANSERKKRMSDEKKEIEKRVNVKFKNPEAIMSLKVTGKNSVDNALKIMKVFDEACSEIRDMEREKKE